MQVKARKRVRRVVVVVVVVVGLRLGERKRRWAVVGQEKRKEVERPLVQIWNPLSLLRQLAEWEEEKEGE